MKDKPVYDSLNPFGFKEVLVNLFRVKEAAVNPRTISDRERLQLKRSLDKFGLIDKPILNLYEGPEDFDFETIGGHQRITVLKEAGIYEANCYVPSRKLSKDEAEELLIRHNKNTGKFDNEKLKLFDAEKLVDWGFLNAELPKVVEVDPADVEVPEPIFPLTPKFSEKYSYVMILVTNEMEKAFLENFFEIEKEQDYKSSKVGLGRVVRFEKFKKIIDERISKASNNEPQKGRKG
jgi:hypothetical protein